MLANLQRHALNNSSKIPMKTLAKVCTGGLILTLAWMLGRMIWAILEPVEPLPPWRPVVTSSARSASSKPQFDLATLQKAELFGKYQASSEPVAQQVVQDAPQTRLSLVLVGVVASNNPQGGLAVISNRNQQSTYGIDETITGTRATLIAVHADRVILRNAGRDETLMLAGSDYSRRAVAEAQPAAPAPAASQSQAASGGNESLGAIRQEILENPQTIFNYIRMSQVTEDGALKGYRVNPGRDRALFDSVGLEPNDLAVELNGADLTDPSVMQQLFKDLQSSTSLSLTVERDGQRHEIFIELQ
uniref:type II secretion system protein GspC n=1 Tax=Thaumasiovibrio occultus TaxID=1891184 RepID=UPI000B34DDFB|nr:type II secretion system protein GspC [Thaumasiovibrio occultus]